MTDQARVVVDHAEQHRRGPLAASGEHRARTEVAVPVPERSDVLRLVAAHLAGGQARLGPLGAGRVALAQPPALAPALRLERAAGCSSTRAPPRARCRARPAPAGCRSEAVLTSSGAPRTALAAPGGSPPPQLLAAGIGAHLAAEHPDRVAPLAARAQQPPFDRRAGEPHRFAADRMLPAARGELLELGAQLPLGGGAASSCPTTEKRRCAHRSCTEPRFDALMAEMPPFLPALRATVVQPAGLRYAHPLRADPAASGSEHAGAAGGDRREPAQQRLQSIPGAAGKALQQRRRQLPDRHRRHQGCGRGAPEGRGDQRLGPPLAPAHDRVAADPHPLLEQSAARRRRPTAQRRDEHHHGAQVNLRSEKPHRGRRRALAAVALGAAQAQPAARSAGSSAAAPRGACADSTPSAASPRSADSRPRAARPPDPHRSAATARTVEDRPTSQHPSQHLLSALGSRARPYAEDRSQRSVSLRQWQEVQALLPAQGPGRRARRARGQARRTGRPARRVRRSHPDRS